MNVWQLVIKEIRYRKLSFALGIASILAAIGCLVGAMTLLKAHDQYSQQILKRKQIQTEQQMAKLKDDMRKATLKLGLNVVILPKDQDRGDWYANDYGSKYMPAEYADKLANSGIVTIRHLLPVLQQRVKWPEKKRTIILVGTRGEVPNLHKSARKPLVQPVPEGKVVLGYELHQSLGLNVGDKVKFMGEEFSIHKCHAERGDKDDITAWIHLGQAQQLLDKRGQINAIIALECICMGRDLSKMRSDIASVLPDTQIFEIGKTKVLARFEARTKAAQAAKAALEQENKLGLHLKEERELFASILVVIVMAACGIWIGFLALTNVRQRRSEIGILRALGFRTGRILCLFLSRAVVMGLAGGILGFIVGFFVGRNMGFIPPLRQGSGFIAEQISVDVATDLPPLLLSQESVGSASQVSFDPALLILALVLAIFLSAVASWIPAVIAAKRDPAEILREE